MGSGRFTASDWNSYSKAHVSGKAKVEDIYVSRSMDNLLDPKGAGIRESCDSSDNPNSTAVIVALDVTGSMGILLDVMAREGLKTLATEIYDRKPISDPHIMFMGVGDVEYDRSPLQVTQFEADIRIAEQLTKLYLEKGGGGNNHESYTLPWYFAAMHTKLDCFEKRGKKGFLFTVGDEEPNKYLYSKDIERFIGDTPQFDKITAESLLDLVSQQYEVFHLMVEEGSHMRTTKSRENVIDAWTALLGQRAMLLSDHTKMAEVIISTLEALSGRDVDSIVNSWDGSTGLVVKNAIKDLESSNTSSGVYMFK